MKIAYLSFNDPLDKNSWVGITYFIAKALQNEGHEVEFLGPLKLPRWLDKVLRAVSKINRVIFRQEYLAKYSLLLAWFCSRRLKKKLKGKTFDCICVPGATAALAFLKTELPVIYITDATFKLVKNYDYNKFRVSWMSIIEGNIMERCALRKSSSVIVSSVWAADSVVRDYKFNKEKVFISPFGANLNQAPDSNIIFNKLQNKQLTLLFVGTDWDRKGGAIAFEVLKFLHYSHDIKARLIVCGCQPPKQYRHPFMEVIPFLNKNKEEDYNRYIDLLSAAHFLIIPTRADSTLLAVSEANAFGVPAITTEIGGVPEVVKDGINGYCLPLTAPATTYASLINELFINEENYKALIASSRQYFENNFTWNNWADSFTELFDKNGKMKMPVTEEILHTV